MKRRNSSLEDLSKKDLYGRFLDDLFCVDNTSLEAVEAFVKERQERKRRRTRKSSLTEEALREFKRTMAEIRAALVRGIGDDEEERFGRIATKD